MVHVLSVNYGSVFSGDRQVVKFLLTWEDRIPVEVQCQIIPRVGDRLDFISDSAETQIEGRVISVLLFASQASSRQLPTVTIKP